MRHARRSPDRLAHRFASQLIERRFPSPRETIGMMTVKGHLELRCPGPTLHGIVNLETKTIELRCKRRRCGVRPGVVVLHTFSLETARLLRTQRFQDPLKEG